MSSWLEFPRDPADDGPPREEGGNQRPADGLMRSGERRFCEGEFEAAARDFRAARRHDPSLFEAWAAEADACLRAGDLPRADAVASEALASYGKVPLFYAAKALVLAHQGQFEAAYHHSDIAVKHQGAGPFTWLARAEVVLATSVWGTMQSAEACFEKARQADPSPWRADLRAALGLMQWGRHERALERLASVAQAVPANPFVWKLTGDCHRALGRPAAAREAYRQALARRPDYAPALEALDGMTAWGRFRRWAAGAFRRKSAPPHA